MSSTLPEDEANPYAAPKAEIGAAIIEPGDAEAIRRAYIEHETTVKAVGSLHFVAAAIGAVVLILVLGLAPDGRWVKVILVGLATLLGPIGVNVALGIGLNRLRAWARWTEAVLAGGLLMGIVAILGAEVYFESPVQRLVVISCIGLLPLYVLYLLLSRKGAIIFSPEYRAIIAETPHVKYLAGRTETSLTAKIALGLIVGLLLMFLLSFLILG